MTAFDDGGRDVDATLPDVVVSYERFLKARDRRRQQTAEGVRLDAQPGVDPDGAAGTGSSRSRHHPSPHTIAP